MTSPPHSSGPIGIAGRGAFAHAIASRIAAGLGSGRILVHGIELPHPKAASARKSPLRVERAATLFDLASECEIIVAVYETRAEVLEAIAGTPERPGLAAALAPGTLIVDMSGGSPGDSAKLAGQLGRGAVGLVEIGIVGHAAAARDSGLALYAGGFGEHVEAVRPILKTLGTLRRAGTQGHGRLLAALIAARATAGTELLGELRAIAEAYDLDEDVFLEAMTGEPGITHGGVEGAVRLAEARGVPVPLLTLYLKQP